MARERRQCQRSRGHSQPRARRRASLPYTGNTTNRSPSFRQRRPTALERAHPRFRRDRSTIGRCKNGNAPRICSKSTEHKDIEISFATVNSNLAAERFRAESRERPFGYWTKQFPPPHGSLGESLSSIVSQILGQIAIPKSPSSRAYHASSSAAL